MMGNFLGGKGAKKLTPLDFLPWRKKKPKAEKAKRAGGQAFFKHAQQLKLKTGLNRSHGAE